MLRHHLDVAAPGPLGRVHVLDLRVRKERLALFDWQIEFRRPVPRTETALSCPEVECGAVFHRLQIQAVLLEEVVAVFP